MNNRPIDPSATLDYSNIKAPHLINSKHVNAEQIKKYQQQFQSSSPQHIIIDDFLTETTLDIVQTLINNTQRFFTQKHLYSHSDSNLRKKSGFALYADDTTWNKTAEEDRFVQRKEWVPPKKINQSIHSELSFTLSLRSLNTPTFTTFLSAITGNTKLHNISNTHTAKLFYCEQSDFIKKHSDGSPNRELCMLLYLTKDWQASDGGQLCFSGDKKNIEITPLYNRCVLFDPRGKAALHWVKQVTSNKARYNITHWYFSD